MENTTKFKILQIDAWNDGGSWSWNNWFTLDEVELPDNMTNRAILKYLRDEGYLSDESKGKLSIDDDGYNITINKASNFMPILALCYGEYL